LIKTLTLKNFRNFAKKELKFDASVNLIIGPNASGNTNILEAIYLLSTGKSFKAKIEEEMVNYDQEIARVKGATNDVNLEVVLTRGEITIGEDPRKIEKAPRKKLLVNGVARKLFDFAGNLKIVLFAPRELDLVTESPGIRREFLDSVISQVDREYRRAILSYEKGLRQRNKLLFRIRDEGLSRSQLLFWDKLLIKNGNFVSTKRREFIDFVNLKQSIDGQTFNLDYDASSISESRLEQYAREEVYAATTLVGPHRDDFVFLSKEKKKRQRELARFGSRGEQRMGVLWLKLAELNFVEERSSTMPTLLLDDIFSELDHEHRDVVARVASKYQSIITTADPHYVANLKHTTKIILQGNTA